MAMQNLLTRHSGWQECWGASPSTGRQFSTWTAVHLESPSQSRHMWRHTENMQKSLTWNQTQSHLAVKRQCSPLQHHGTRFNTLLFFTAFFRILVNFTLWLSLFENKSEKVTFLLWFQWVNRLWIYVSSKEFEFCNRTCSEETRCCPAELLFFPAENTTEKNAATRSRDWAQRVCVFSHGRGSIHMCPHAMQTGHLMPLGTIVGMRWV